MSSISRKQVQHTAKLARIELSKKEEEKFTKELSSILDYVKQLNKVNTKDIESIKQITGLKDVVRSDTQMGIRIKSELDASIINKILKNVPKKKGDFIQVPKILE